jgi:LysR family glycine cleavage system transcriptional activator
MKHPLPPLDSLKVFESAARHLSFSQAARELCVTKGAVSYQVRRLEENLDCALFERSVRRVFLTRAGQQLLRTTQRTFEDLDDTFRRIRPHDSAHDVLIGVTTYVALRWLSPRIARFTQSNRDVSILLQHSVNDDDFRMQDVDFAIRWGPMEEKVSPNRPLQLAMPLFPVCSPKLLESCPPPAGGFDNEEIVCTSLASIALLCEERPLDLWQTWYGEQAIPLENPRRVIADANVRTQAAIDGQGWTLADALMQRELDSGDLVAPFARSLDGYGYAIQAAPDRYVNRKAREFMQWLVDKA